MDAEGLFELRTHIANPGELPDRHAADAKVSAFSNDPEYPLAELLLADVLVVDVLKPFDENGYLEIEPAMLRDTDHQSCGGRWIDDDNVDSWLTFLVNNGGNGPRVSDGADEPFARASRTFPNMPRPNLNPPPPPPPTRGAIVK